MIDIKNTDFSYNKNSRKIFSDLNLSLKQGHVYGILGKNGVGKTTLLKLLCGLLYNDSGYIKVLGEEAKKRTPYMLENLFFVPDTIILPDISSKKYGKIYGKYYPRYNQGDFTSYLNSFEINENIKMSNLSLGQKKKAYISFAFACNTDIILLDEPTNDLDIPSKQTIRKIISSLSSTNKLILISTHVVRDIAQLLDSVVILDQDKVLLNETLEDISKHLSFKEIKENDTPLYYEQTIHGKWGVVINEDEKDNENAVDIEMLFNAALSNKKLIKDLFKNK